MQMPIQEAQEEALQALAYIRAVIDRTARYSTFSALSGCVAGGAALAGSGLCGWARGWPGARPEEGFRFLGVWLAVFAVAAVGLFVLTGLKARQRGEPAWTPIARTALSAMLGPGVAGLAGTIALAALDQWAFLPGLWLLLYGCAFYGVSFFAPLFLRVLGLGFMGLGLAAWLSGPAWAGLWLGVGFGGLHLVFSGIVLARYRR